MDPAFRRPYLMALVLALRFLSAGLLVVTLASSAYLMPAMPAAARGILPTLVLFGIYLGAIGHVLLLFRLSRHTLRVCLVLPLLVPVLASQQGMRDSSFGLLFVALAAGLCYLHALSQEAMLSGGEGSSRLLRRLKAAVMTLPLLLLAPSGWALLGGALALAGFLLTLLCAYQMWLRELREAIAELDL